MRKVLSFVLVLSLVLGSFSMAFAAEGAGLTDVAGNANADAIQVAYDLEIITGNPDGTFQPEKAVNRAEFAAMITRALAIPDSALAGYTSTTFKDTVGYGWAVPYLAFCQSKGIMLGDGAGNVMPGRTITVNEAVTMALRAIGYTQNSALLVGAWPANYVSIAQNEELYDDVDSDTTVNKASAAQIIYNLLTVQKVAVNSDGDTEFLWSNRANTVAANLLNTNLGATEKPDIILGDNYGYGASLINITGKLGAFGTAYVNDDNEVIAFTEKSTALTGKVDGTKFKVGDTKYDFDAIATDGAVFYNADQKSDAELNTAAKVTAAAVGATDDDKTITLNVDLSGKKIKQVYSLVAWKADKAELADSDVQEDITDDSKLLSKSFAENDDDEIDLKSFQLVGAASLADIEEDDVVYVYTDGTDIRKVAVGTETVEGTVEETDGTDTITIDGKDYDIAKVKGSLALDIPGDVDVDSDGTFYLDYAGKVFDFEGSDPDPDTFAVVKAAYDAGSAYTDERIKLYLSDDSSKTFNFADDLDDIDVTTISSIAAIDPVTDGLTTGSLIGYALDADGDIDALNVAAATGMLDIQSSKVLNFDNTDVSGLGDGYYTIDSSAVVFTYEGVSLATATDFGVADASELRKISTSGAIILNDDNKVVAILVHENAVDADEDDVYGVFNDRFNAKTGDDNVYRFTGWIDGAEFSKKTEDRSDSDYNSVAGVFGVYKITVDVNDVITAVATIDSAPNTDKSDGNTGNNASGKITPAAVPQITSVNSDGTVITAGGSKYTIEDDAIVYEYDTDDEAYTLADLSDLDDGQYVALYDTKGKDADGVATIVIFYED